MVLTTTGSQSSLLDIGTLSFADLRSCCSPTSAPAGGHAAFSTPSAITGSIDLGNASGIIGSYVAELSLGDLGTDVFLTVAAVPEAMPSSQSRRSASCAAATPHCGACGWNRR